MYATASQLNILLADTDYTVIASPGVGKRIIVHGSQIHSSNIQGHWYENSSSNRDLGPSVPLTLDLSILMGEDTSLVYRANYLGANTYVSVYYSVIDA